MNDNTLSVARFAPLLEGYFLKYMISQKASVGGKGIQDDMRRSEW